MKGEYQTPLDCGTKSKKKKFFWLSQNIFKKQNQRKVNCDTIDFERKKLLFFFKKVPGKIFSISLKNQSSFFLVKEKKKRQDRKTRQVIPKMALLEKYNDGWLQLIKKFAMTWPNVKPLTEGLVWLQTYFEKHDIKTELWYKKVVKDFEPHVADLKENDFMFLLDSETKIDFFGKIRFS